MSLPKLDIDNNFKDGSMGAQLREASGAIKSDQNSRWPVSDTFSARSYSLAFLRGYFLAEFAEFAGLAELAG